MQQNIVRFDSRFADPDQTILELLVLGKIQHEAYRDRADVLVDRFLDPQNALYVGRRDLASIYEDEEDMPTFAERTLPSARRQAA